MAASNNATAIIDIQALPSEDEHYTEIMTGLRAEQKTINPKFFYDKLGSQLFEEITQLTEYYPTRTEISILQQHAAAISRLLGERIHLIEPGAGSCEKVRYLLEALRPERYLPMDISTDFLQQSVDQLLVEHPWLEVQAIAADFNHDIDLPDFPDNDKVVVFYPGSTIGNFEPKQAVDFLRRLSQWVLPDGGILLGVDLEKDEEILDAAYNDADGITEQFNLNVLNNINSLIDSNFEVDNFSHYAYYNQTKHRIEMHLRADRSHQVNCGGERIEFEAGETIHTENSYKYTVEGIAELARQAGLRLQQNWCDKEGLFSMNYLVNA